MMLSEFIERTGFEPTADEYSKIEEVYYDFDGDKDAFCKAFVENGSELKAYKARAVKIAQLRSQMLEVEKQYKKDVADRDRRIADLETVLDQELAWQPATDVGTRMDQRRYETLARSGKKITEQEAKELIAEECGFSIDKIVILNKACAYEVNKYKRLRPSAEYERDPVYESTDWNYIRFDCANFMYELVNGELHFYNC